MQVDVNLRGEIFDGLVSDVILVMNTATYRGVLSEDYLRGAISLALAQAISYGISRRKFIGRVKEEIGVDIGRTISLEAIL